jgi:glycosyltransferase involved in cell wall biosynthesis
VQLYLGLHKLARLGMRLALRAIDEYVVLSPYFECHFSRLAPSTPRTVIPNCVEDRFFQIGEEREAPDGRGFRILFVGAIGQRKGVRVLLDALPPVVTSVPSVRVRIVGFEEDAGAVDRFTRRVRELGLEEVVEFPGPLCGSELYAEYALANVLVLPTFAEAQPVVLIEAMAAGVPVITTSIPPIQSIIAHGQHGLLIPPGDSTKLAAALCQLYADPDLCARLASNGKAEARRRYSAERFLRDLARLYDRLISRALLASAHP